MGNDTNNFLSCFGRYSHAIAGLFSVLLACVLLSGLAVGAEEKRRLAPPEPSKHPIVSSQAISDLQSAIGLYRAIADAGGWPALPRGKTLRPGDNDEAVAILRRRLEISGDLVSGSGGDYVFDEAVEDAVKRFQRRHGLEPNGIVYGITQRTLNVPVEARIQQLQRNLDRIAGLLPKLEGTPRYLLMNAASFELQGIADGRVKVTSRVISGKRKTPTPVVSTSVRAINLLPAWHVPETIAKAALIPAIRKNPTYLYQERIRVFSSFGGDEIDPAAVNWFGEEAYRYVFRQDPGPHNALGLLRFDMPNKHIVYMHDTPMKKLFGTYERAYSAGCVRVQSFSLVAGWILSGQDGWTVDTLNAAIAAGAAQTIKLDNPIPVHFIYLTAWVEDGRVHFRNDLYNWDEASTDAGAGSLAPLQQAIAP